jgi:hypothetical protein
MRFRYANLASATGVAAETGISAADKAVLDYATSSAKLDHIFAAKHNFHPLVQQVRQQRGSRAAVPTGRWRNLYQCGRLSDTTFMRGGSVVDNPFAELA